MSFCSKNLLFQQGVSAVDYAVVLTQFWVHSTATSGFCFAYSVCDQEFLYFKYFIDIW
jgi:hypothetical protein